MSAALAAALRPVSAILADTETEDLAIQEPGVGWRLARGSWQRLDLPAMTYDRLAGLSALAAAQTRQRINAASPILSCDLPGNLRLQSVMSPAVPSGTMALTWRRGDAQVDELEDIPRLYNTTRFNQWDGRLARRRERDAQVLAAYDAGDFEEFLRVAVRSRLTGLFCGPTGAGKSRLSRLLGGAIGLGERIITIEDALELVVRQPNHVRHLYPAEGQGGLTAARLMKAALRERPTRILLGEMRDKEAAEVFVDEVMAGHPGSLSTIHGSTAAQAAKRLFNYYKSSSAGATMKDETVASQVAGVIDFICPVEMGDGRLREIGEVWLKPDAARRGETLHNLLTGD